MISRDRLARVVRSRSLAALVGIGILVLLLSRIPFPRLLDALREANHALFIAVMIPNTVFYFCWDTLLLTKVVGWFHGPLRYRDLLPARAASYVVGFFNTNAGRGALAAYLSKRLGSPFLQLGSTVLFLVLTEFLHLVAWAAIGIAQIRDDTPAELLLAPPAIALVWLTIHLYARSNVAPPSARWLFAPREWALLRTFRLAHALRYVQVVLLRAPMFFASLCLHAVAARSFGLDIQFAHMVAFLPVIFMVAALPISVARLGTTQAAWLFFFSPYADEATLLAFSLAAHLTFVTTRSLLGLAFLPRAYTELLRAEVTPRIPERAPAESYR
jgi:hypothetical protein